MDQLTDEELLLRIRQDDEKAYKALVSRYLNKIWRLSFNILHNKEDAEDVAQEVFITVWNQRHKWEAGEASFSTWLYRVGVNKSIDFKRRRKAPTAELNENIADSDEKNTDDFTALKQQRELFSKMLKELPEKQMLCLLLYYYEDLNIQQICTRLKSTEDSVRSLLKRGKASLREVMQGKLVNATY